MSDRITDPDWIRFFGTTSSQLEPVPKPPRKKKLTTGQTQANLIQAAPELFGGAKKHRGLFDNAD